MTSPTHFEQLLQAAAAQPEPQRLLFVFAAAELPDDASPAQRERFAAGQGGALVPLACVDKDPADLTDFEALVAESRQASPPWQAVFIAGLAGENGRPPSAQSSRQRAAGHGGQRAPGTLWRLPRAGPGRRAAHLLLTAARDAGPRIGRGHRPGSPARPAAMPPPGCAPGPVATARRAGPAARPAPPGSANSSTSTAPPRCPRRQAATPSGSSTASTSRLPARCRKCTSAPAG